MREAINLHLAIVFIHFSHLAREWIDVHACLSSVSAKRSACTMLRRYEILTRWCSPTCSMTLESAVERRHEVECAYTRDLSRNLKNRAPIFGLAIYTRMISHKSINNSVCVCARDHTFETFYKIFNVIKKSFNRAFPEVCTINHALFIYFFFVFIYFISFLFISPLLFITTS